MYSKEKETTFTKKIWSRAVGMTNCLMMMDKGKFINFINAYSLKAIADFYDKAFLLTQQTNKQKIVAV